MASADVHFKAVVLLFFIRCLLLLSVCVGFVFWPCNIMLYLVCYLVITDEDRAGCLILVVIYAPGCCSKVILLLLVHCVVAGIV